MIHNKPQSKNTAKRGRSWHQNGKTTKCKIYNFLDFSKSILDPLNLTILTLNEKALFYLAYIL